MEKRVKFVMITAFLILSLATVSSASAAHTYGLNDTSYSNYFNSTGYINHTNVQAGDVLDITGDINNKDMYIDLPLNITSTNTTASIINGTITILAGGSGTNITNLNIINNRTDSNSYGIHLIGSNNNHIIGNTITTVGNGTGASGNGYLTYGVYLENSSNNLFDSNTIKTTGVSTDADYGTYPNPAVYATTGVYLKSNSNNNKFTNNNITTDYNDVISSYGYDTLGGVRIIGSSNNQFTGNHINTVGNAYVYGVGISGTTSSTASKNTVSGNIINTNGVYYADGIDVEIGDKKIVTENTVVSQNIIKSVADSVSYGIYIAGASGNSSLKTTVTGNKVTSIANINYVLELFSANDNTIKDNVLTGIGNYSLGIGAYSSNNNLIRYNTITSVGDNSAPYVSSGDAIPAGNEGIKLIQNSTKNIIQYNVINSVAVYAINTTQSSNNTITNNYLVSDNGNKQGNKAVTTGTGDILTGNYGKKPTADFTVNTNGGIGPLTVLFTNNAKGEITNWAWDFNNDGKVDCEALYSTYTFTKAGTYAVKLTVTGPGGSDNKIVYITVKKDTVAPVAKANVKSGSYKTNQKIKLTVTDNADSNPKIYYTLNGHTPTTKSALYKGTISISKTTTLKFIATDVNGNKSPVHTQKYTIDKTAPKVVKSSPAKNTSKISLTAPITIKFSENILKGINYSKIYLKNMNTGKLVAIKVSVKGNTMTIKQTKSRLHNNKYQVYIPSAALKDKIGNNAAKYTFKFKTG